ncbi:MAG: tail fiber domain-containing protein [Candidatus Pacebacteria bacterium]|nr:tail fiber domain-containing protein [Candidatus Paceibacterota bacterium]
MITTKNKKTFVFYALQKSFFIIAIFIFFPPILLKPVTVRADGEGISDYQSKQSNRLFLSGLKIFSEIVNTGARKVVNDVVNSVVALPGDVVSSANYLNIVGFEEIFVGGAKTIMKSFADDTLANVNNLNERVFKKTADSGGKTLAAVSDFFGIIKETALSLPRGLNNFIFDKKDRQAAENEPDVSAGVDSIESAADSQKKEVSPNNELAKVVSVDNYNSDLKILERKYDNLNAQLSLIKQSGLVIEGPVIERKTIERLVEKTVSVSDDEETNKKLADMETRLNNQISNLSSQTSRQFTGAYQTISLTNKIDNLSNITLSNVSGLADSDIPDDITASNYLPLSGGTLTGALVGASASFASTLTVSASTTFNGVEYKWPFSDGTANQVLATNGAGGLSWTTVSGGSGASDFIFATNYGVTVAATSSPVWLQNSLYASSTSVFQGLATFGNASTTQLSVTGPAYLTSLGQGWLHTAGGTNALTSSTSPTVAYLTATSSAATSTFPYLSVTTNSNLGTVVGGAWQGTAIGDAYLTKSGDWTGTLDTYEASSLLSRANHTGTQNMSTLSNYDFAFSSNYGANNLTGSTTMPWWAQGGINASSTSRFVYASTTALTVSGNSYLGTVSQGTWNGAAIGVGYGGTGLTSISQGQTLVASDANTLQATSTLTILSSGNVGVGTASPETLLHIDGNGISMKIRSASDTGSNGVGIQGDRSRGTASSPTAIQADDMIFSLASRGYDGSAFSTQSAIRTFASQNWTGTNKGTYMTFLNTPDNSTTATEYMRITSSGNIGVGTTSPYAKLSVSGDTALDSMFVNFASSSAPSLTLNYFKSATSTIPNNTPYAWTIATSTSVTPIFAISTNGAGLTAATTSINGGLNVNSGGIIYDSFSGITTINSLEAGPMNFDDNAGTVSWFDMSVTSASAVNTKHSYTAQIDSNPVLTVYGESDGGGNAQNFRVGIGTTTPLHKLSIHNATTSSAVDADIGFTATSTGLMSWYNWTMGIDQSDGGKFKISSSTALGTNDKLVIDGSGQVGIATSSPWRTFDVSGTVGFKSLTTAVGTGSLCLSSNNEVTYNAADTCLSSLRATKHGIETLTVSGLDLINALEPVSFVYNKEYGDNRTRYGFIAEDAAGVDSRFATYNGSVMSGIDDRAILSVAVKAIKELNLKVDSLVLDGVKTTDGRSLFDFVASKLKDAVVFAKEFVADKVTAKEMKTDKICVGATCVTEDQFKNIFGNSQSASSLSQSSAPGQSSTSSSSSEAATSSQSSLSSSESSSNSSSSEESSSAQSSSSSEEISSSTSSQSSSASAESSSQSEYSSEASQSSVSSES